MKKITVNKYKLPADITNSYISFDSSCRGHKTIKKQPTGLTKEVECITLFQVDYSQHPKNDKNSF